MAAPSYVYQLLSSETVQRWGADAALGSPVTITYSFPSSQSSNTTYSGFTPSNTVEIAATRQALAQISSFTNISFVETTSGGEMLFGNADLTPFGSGVSGRATYSFTPDGIQNATVVIANAGPASLAGSTFQPGSIAPADLGGQGWQTLLHEIGHALGLKHSFDRNAAGDPNSVMPASIDHIANTVMSYTAFQPSNVAIVTENGDGTYSYTYSSLKPQTFSVFDVAALQYLYGTDTTSAGGKVYAFRPDAPIFMTITDAGPNNTIDCSALTGACRIDMTPGASSDLAISQTLRPDITIPDRYDGTSALTIAYSAKVANAYGGSGADHITGNAIANTIVGGAGVDTMAGGAGADTYWVDNSGDVVTETGAGGTVDRVFASVSYALAAGQQIDLLATNGVAKTTAINLSGNEVAQTLQGNAGKNVLVGGGGADTMAGYGGADDYWVDNAGDVVAETGAGNSVDRVFASVSYALGAGQQIDVLATNGITKTTAVNLTGNDLAQAIQGNAGANVLAGRGGGDALFGFGGADRLYGGLGSDKLDGGAGNDVFVFDTGLNAATNVDTINAYSVAADTIWLDDAVFLGLARGGLSSAAFTTGAAATDGADRIVYNGSTGALLFDRDGSGSTYAAVQFAKLAAGLAMAAGEFAVV